MNLTSKHCVVTASNPSHVGAAGAAAAKRAKVQASFTQDAGCDAHANSNANPLMLLAYSVNTPIDNNRSHLLALRCASHRASCVNGASTNNQEGNMLLLL